MYRYIAHLCYLGTAQILQALKSQNQLVVDGSGSGLQKDKSLDPFWRKITLFQNPTKYDYIQIKSCSSRHITQKERRRETEWSNFNLWNRTQATRRPTDLCTDLDIAQKTTSSNKVGKGALGP